MYFLKSVIQILIGFLVPFLRFKANQALFLMRKTHYLKWVRKLIFLKIHRYQLKFKQHQQILLVNLSRLIFQFLEDNL